MDEGMDFEARKSRSLQTTGELVEAVQCVNLSELRGDAYCDI